MSVDIAQRSAGKAVPSRWLKAIAQAILDAVGRPDAELSVALIGNAEMRRLNALYRQKDYPTDVLSFPVESNAPGAGGLLGDVVISVETARAQALDHGRGSDEEIIALLIHGVVHLLGFDHERSAKDARAMRRMENKVRSALCERRLLQV